MGNLDVDPETIKKGGAGIRTAAQDARKEWESLKGTLEGYGDPCGGDMLGMLIGGCYGAIFAAAAECIESNIDGILGHAEGATVMASTYFQAEDASEVEVNRVRAVLG